MCKLFKSILSIFVVLGLALSSQSASAEQKVATIDIPKIIDQIVKNSPAGQAFEKRKSAEKAKLVVHQNELEKIDQQLREAGAKPESPEAESFRKKIREYQRQVSDTEESLGKEFLGIQKEVVARIRASVNKIAKEEDITVVLTKSEAVPTAVLYSDNSLDITEKVLSDLND